jgi:DNA-binding NtrC family response regulator/tetratricopeptide (TPR) repeat protein
MASITNTERLLLAELLERTGRLEDSRAQLAKLEKSSTLSNAERARCLLVQGLLDEQKGHLVDACKTLQKAWRAAECDGATDLIGWCQLRLVGVYADLNWADLEAPLLSDLRRNVEMAAVPALSIAHQVFLAEYHAKRGDLTASRHYTNVAESVLFSFPNVWLRGLLDLHQSCLSYLEGNYLESLLAARRALATSCTSGHSLTELIAQADLAAAYLAIGQPARARACLAAALKKSNREEQIFGLLLETLAEAQLISGDLVGCAESLKTASDITTSLSQSRSTWHQSWNLRTQVRLLQREGHWQESLTLIRSVGPREPPASRSFTKAQIESLEALALAKLRRTEEARDVLQTFVQESLVAVESYRCSIWPALAALSAVTDGNTLAVSQCVQALRIVGATGEASTLVETAEQLIRLLDGDSSQASGSMEPECEKPLWRPTNIVCHLDASSRLVPSASSNSSEFAALLSALADAVPDPAALGEEALRYLVSMGSIKSGSVIQRIDGETYAVVSYDSGGSIAGSETASGNTPPTTSQVYLGSKQSRRYELTLRPHESGQAVATCHGMVRLLASLRAAESKELRKASPTERDLVTPEAGNDWGLFRSSAMLALLASAKRVAPLGITVLLTGESGTGKEVVANIIHRASGAPPDAFVAFNCATVPRDMVDSQLFGYRRGAFTGAAQGFKGVISAADGGTLLLDEVGELPLETQPKLLRFLDSGEVLALGEAIPRKLKVRIVAATNADLETLVERGRFREDLYYRLNVVRFRLPPLRERREEILPLVSFFLSRYSLEFGKHDIQLSDAAREHLLLYAWPGNVRQLSHEIRRLVALSDSDSIIDVQALDNRVRGRRGEPNVPSVLGSRSITVRVDRTLAEAIREVENAAITDALESAAGRLDVAARRLGLSRKGLYLKRQRLGLG